MDQNEFTNEIIDFNRLPNIDEIEFSPISRAYLWVMIISALIRYAFLFTAYFILAFSFRDYLEVGIRRMLPLLLIALVGVGLFRLYKIHQKKGYALRDHDITYKSGWLWKRVTTIPYHRIQHCDLSSGPFERMFDLSTLNIYTAGGSQSDLSIPGLLIPHGEQLKKFILQKMGQDEEE